MGRKLIYHGEGAPSLKMRLEPELRDWIQAQAGGGKRASSWVRAVLTGLRKALDEGSIALEVIQGVNGHKPLCVTVRPVSSEPTPDDSVPPDELPEDHWLQQARRKKK